MMTQNPRVRIPHGMTNLVYKYWDSINKLVSDELGQPNLLGSTDPQNGMYGCGIWGCAYPTSDPNTAVKITADPTEGPIVSAIINTPSLRKHPGVAYIHNIWRLPEKTLWRERSPKDVYVILREDITPIPDHDKRKQPIEYEAEEILDELRETGYELNSAMNYNNTAGMELYTLEWEDLVELAQRNKFLVNIADFMIRFREQYTYVLADIHGGNIGYRGGKVGTPWVAFDVGHSDISAGFMIPFIKNPRVVNPEKRDAWRLYR